MMYISAADKTNRRDASFMNLRNSLKKHERMIFMKNPSNFNTRKVSPIKFFTKKTAGAPETTTQNGTPGNGFSAEEANSTEFTEKKTVENRSSSQNAKSTLTSKEERKRKSHGCKNQSPTTTSNQTVETQPRNTGGKLHSASENTDETPNTGCFYAFICGVGLVVIAIFIIAACMREVFG